MTKHRKTYLTPDDADAFLDFPPPLMHLHEPYKGKLPEGKIICAQCKGHGGWNLTINAYYRPSQDQIVRWCLDRQHLHPTEEQIRHHWQHFKASCSNCNGWGYVDEKQGDHIHEWLQDRNVGNCLNVYKCKTCGEEQTVDSSD